MERPFHVSPKAQKWLGEVVLRVIDTALAQKDIVLQEPDPAYFDAEELATLTQNGSLFVTLKINDRLRGCIGSISPYEPLFQNAHRMAYSAAFNDPRFPPLTSAEWPKCSVEISVLSEATPCPDLNQIEIGRHGLILRYKQNSGVFLPQVPVEQGWNLQEYLDNLCLKAGVRVGTYREPDCQILWYEAHVFPVKD